MKFDNDMIGLADAVAAVRQALLPRLLSIDGDLDTLEKIQALNVPYPPLPDGLPAVKRQVQGKIQVAKNRLFWREQKAMELSAGLLRRLVNNAADRERGPRKSLLFVIPYDIADGTTGGASRLYGLARCLGRDFDVRMITPVSADRDADAISLYEGVTLYLVPKTRAFVRRVDEMRTQYGDAAALLAMHEGADLMPLLGYWIETLGADASAVFIDGPPLLNVVRRALPCKPVVYESPNVYQKFVRILSQGAQGDAAFTMAERLEREISHLAKLVVCVSEEDRAFIAATYGVPAAKTVVVPNGVGAQQSLFHAPAATQRLKEFSGVKKPVALFVGSNHKPNVEAVKFIAGQLAPQFSDAQFVVVGMTAADFCGLDASLPPNLTVTGKLREAEKEAVFALADVALCPVISGSGSSLKIPDYAAHGKPVVSTAFGIRGFEELPSASVVAELDSFGAALRKVFGELRERPDSVERKCRDARSVIEAKFDWRPVTDGLIRALAPVLGGGA